MRSWMIGFVVGCGVVSQLPQLLPEIAIGLCGLFGGLCLMRHSAMWLCCSGILTGLVVAHFHGYAILSSRVAEDCEANLLRLEGFIVSLPAKAQIREGVWQQRFLFHPTDISPGKCVGPDRLLLSYYGNEDLMPGQRWQFEAKLKRPWGQANPGGFNRQAWYVASGIDGVGAVAKNSAILLSPEIAKSSVNHLLRSHIGSAISTLERESAALSLLKAVTIGDKSGISYATSNLLRQFGVNHLFVVSGLHIGLSAGLGYAVGGALSRFLFALGMSRLALLAAPVMGLMLALFYSAMAGFSLPVLRALVMLASFTLASAFGRFSVSWNSLLIACTIIVLINPLAVLGSGFWLSFTAVLALLWLGMWRSNVNVVYRLLATHVCMALLMIPLGGFWFGGASLVSVIANVVSVPVVGLIVVPMSLSAGLLNLANLPGHRLLWTVAAWPLEQGLKIAQWLAVDDTFGYVHLSPSPCAMVIGVAALALLIVPVSLRLKCILPLLAAPVFMAHNGATTDELPLATITILDVGQGTAAVVRSGDSTLVYDTGGGHPQRTTMADTVLLPFLRLHGVKSIETLMISHSDNDHSAGVETLLRAMPVDELVVGGNPLDYAQAESCVAGVAWQWSPRVRFQVLSPSTWLGETSNDASCVLMVHVGEYRMLLAGDIGANVERELALYWGEALQSNSLLASHHGSVSSTASAWLKTVQPQTLIFSNGYLNRFGHPHAVITKRGKLVAEQMYSTALGGALTITVHRSGAVELSMYRDTHRRYWH